MLSKQTSHAEWPARFVVPEREREKKKAKSTSRKKESSLYGDSSVLSMPRARLTTATTSRMVTSSTLSTMHVSLLGGALVGGGQTLGGGAGARHCEYEYQKTDAHV